MYCHGFWKVWVGLTCGLGFRGLGFRALAEGWTVGLEGSGLTRLTGLTGLYCF